MAGNPLIFLGGLVAVAGVGYYLYQAKYFDKILDAINDAIGSIKPGNGNGNGNGEPKPKCSSGKIECKDGKCDTQSKCDSQAKCKSGEHWNPTTKKCAKTSNLAMTMAYSAPQLGISSHRGYIIN